MKFYFTKINLFHKYIFSRKIAIYGKNKNKFFVQKRNHPTWSHDQVWSRDQSAIFSCPNFTVFTHALACSRWSWNSVMSSDEKDSDKGNVSIGSFYVEVTGDVITPQGDAVARNRDVTTPEHGGVISRLASGGGNYRGSSHTLHTLSETELRHTNELDVNASSGVISQQGCLNGSLRRCSGAPEHWYVELSQVLTIDPAWALPDNDFPAHLALAWCHYDF